MNFWLPLAQGKETIEAAAEVGENLAGMTPAAIFATLFVLCLLGLLGLVRWIFKIRKDHGDDLDEIRKNHESEKETIRKGYTKALEEKKAQVAKLETDVETEKERAKGAEETAKNDLERFKKELAQEAAGELKTLITGYIDEIKLLRETLAEAKVTIARGNELREKTNAELAASTATRERVISIAERVERRLDAAA